MASHPDSPPTTGPDTQTDSFEPGLGGAGTDARPDGEPAYLPSEDSPPPEDQPMPPEDQPMPAEGQTGAIDSPGDFAGTSGTGGINKVQDSEFER